MKVLIIIGALHKFNQCLNVRSVKLVLAEVSIQQLPSRINNEITSRYCTVTPRIWSLISHGTGQALICIVLDDIDAERALEKSSQANLSVENSTSINIEWENAAMFLQPLHTTLLCSTRNDNHLTPQLTKFIHPSRYALQMYVAKTSEVKLQRYKKCVLGLLPDIFKLDDLS